MGLSAPGQNATVEEILASIRQAISEDDARRTGERRPEPRPLTEPPSGLGATAARPRHLDLARDEDEADEVAEFAADAEADQAEEPEEYAADDIELTISEEIEVEVEVEAAAEEPEDTPPDDDDAPRDPTHDVIELAIEKAISGVRAELEGRRAQQSRLRSRVDDINSRMGQQRPLPRTPLTQGAAPRREIPAPPPLRTGLLSPRSDAKVHASFDNLAKAMIAGNSQQLNAVVEDLLRPMLKQWLEGNLPQMVERLVREEIERVSRGRRP